MASSFLPPARAAFRASATRAAAERDPRGFPSGALAVIAAPFDGENVCISHHRTLSTPPAAAKNGNAAKAKARPTALIRFIMILMNVEAQR
jgi:hypothetical protein